MKDLYDKQEEERITQAIEEMKSEAGSGFSLEKLNLSELERRCGVSRMRLRRLKKNNFEFKPHGNTGKPSPQRGPHGLHRNPGFPAQERSHKFGSLPGAASTGRFSRRSYGSKDVYRRPQGFGALQTASCGAARQPGPPV